MKRNKKIAVLLSLCLSVCLLFSACSIPGFDFKLPWGEQAGDHGKGDRRTIPYKEIEYQRPDAEKLKSDLRQMVEKAKNASDYKELDQLDEEAGDLLEEYYTMRTYAELRKYMDVNDEYYEEEYRLLDDQSIELSNLTNDFMRVFVEGPFSEDYRADVGDYVFQRTQDNLRLNSPEVEGFKKERAALNTDYNKMLTTLTVEYQGKEYTLTELDTIEDPYTMLMQRIEFFKKYKQDFTALYAKMIELDNQTATTLGFESAAEMYYLSYNRDYTPKQALELCQRIKEIFAPLVPNVLMYSGGTESPQMKKTFKTMPDVLKKVDPELGQAWDHMTYFGMYNYDPDSSKQDVAFTTTLYKYDSPFCYGYWKDNVRSVTTVMHEFGHYYDRWLHYEGENVFNLDRAETYSQGLELLLHEYLGEFVENPEDARLYNLQDFIQAITYQALYEEFQIQLYQMETLEPDQIAELYTQLLQEYGYGMYILPDQDGLDHSWYDVTHIYDAPFYTISYTTSALVALQIWAQSQKDWRTGADTYLELMRSDQNQPFTEMVAAVGLQGTADTDTLKQVASYFEQEFRLENSSAELPEAA